MKPIWLVLLGICLVSCVNVPLSLLPPKTVELEQPALVTVAAPSATLSDRTNTPTARPRRTRLPRPTPTFEPSPTPMPSQTPCPMATSFAMPTTTMKAVSFFDAILFADPARRGVYASAALRNSPSVLWRFSIPCKGIGFFNPVLSGNLIFVGATDGFLYALDQETGELIWRFEAGGWLSSPTIYQGVLYLANGTLYALKPETGELLWKIDAGVGGSPVIGDGILYAGSGDMSLHAIDLSVRREIWKYGPVHKTETDVTLTDPAFADGIVYFSGGHGAYALDARTGELVWKIDTDSVFGSGILVSNSVAYGITFDGTLYALNAKTGKTLWKKLSGAGDNLGGPPNPASTDNILFSGSTDFYAMDARSGATRWEFTTDKFSFSAPTIAENVVYFEREGTLYAFETTSGKKLWEWSPHTRELSAAALANRTLFISDSDGNVFALR